MVRNRRTNSQMEQTKSQRRRQTVPKSQQYGCRNKNGIAQNIDKMSGKQKNRQVTGMGKNRSDKKTGIKASVSDHLSGKRWTGY